MELEEKQQLEAELRLALQNDEFTLFYQPKIDLVSGEIKGVEALLRWDHPKKGVISPLEFIPLIEETGLIFPIGEWALRTACQQIKSWQKAGMPPLIMAVNLSSPQFYRPNLVKMIERVLKETQLLPELLELEITESMVMDVKTVFPILNDLKRIGVLISLDDFGIGYSSLSYLKQFPIDIIKIDQSFVQNCTVDIKDGTIVKAIVAMAHQLQIEVVAEGVETKDQLIFLQQNLCNKGQGYLFSQPLPQEEFVNQFNEIEKIIKRDGIPPNINKEKWLEQELVNARQELRAQGMVFKFIENGGRFIHTLCDGELMYRLGYTSEKIVGKELYDFLPLPDAKEKYQHYLRAWEGEETVTYEASLNGIWYLATLRPILKGGQVVEVIGSCVDISRLKESEERYRKVVEFSPLGIVIHKDGEILYANPSALEIVQEESLIEKSVTSYIHPDDLNIYKQRIVKMKIGKENPIVEWRLLRRDGQVIDIEIRSVAIPYSGSSATLSMYCDITSRKKVEEDLRIAKKNAENANEMKSMFLSQMSHDLRTPLNTIQGFTQILLSDYDKSRVKEIHKLKKIEGASKHLLNLIDELLDFSAIEAGILKIVREKIHLRTFINHCVNSITENSNNNGVSFFIKPIDSNLYVCTDPVRLKQILDNLLINAIKYNKSEGHVFVYVEKQDSKVIIKVSDTGIGIPKNEINSIFDPFYRSKRNMSNWKGTGLGLAIVAKLTKKLRGEFGVNSEEGVGSTFWVCLPKINGNNRVTKKFENVSPPKQIKDKTILYIEDNLDNIQLIEAMLEIMGTIELISEHSGAAGLKKALEVHPDLIFLDLNLPDIDGLMLLSQLKNNQITQDIPVVVISAEACELKIKEATKRGSYKYIKKPVNMSELHSVIKEVMS
jgi:PAS domain S-box-containing protein